MTKTIPEQQRNPIIHIFAAEKQEKDDYRRQYSINTERGGLRGVFTCGVLDCFMDKGLPQE